jgi:hypothetical protein
MNDSLISRIAFAILLFSAIGAILAPRSAYAAETVEVYSAEAFEAALSDKDVTQIQVRADLALKTQRLAANPSKESLAVYGNGHHIELPQGAYIALLSDGRLKSALFSNLSASGGDSKGFFFAASGASPSEAKRVTAVFENFTYAGPRLCSMEGSFGLCVLRNVMATLEKGAYPAPFEAVSCGSIRMEGYVDVQKPLTGSEGGIDEIFRIKGSALYVSPGAKVTVENKGGSGEAIGTSAFAYADSDGAAFTIGANASFSYSGNGQFTQNAPLAAFIVQPGAICTIRINTGNGVLLNDGGMVCVKGSLIVDRGGTLDIQSRGNTLSASNRLLVANKVSVMEDATFKAALIGNESAATAVLFGGNGPSLTVYKPRLFEVYNGLKTGSAPSSGNAIRSAANGVPVDITAKKAIFFYGTGFKTQYPPTGVSSSVWGDGESDFRAYAKLDQNAVLAQLALRDLSVSAESAKSDFERSNVIRIIGTAQSQQGSKAGEKGQLGDLGQSGPGEPKAGQGNGAPEGTAQPVEVFLSSFGEVERQNGLAPEKGAQGKEYKVSLASEGLSKKYEKAGYAFDAEKSVKANGAEGGTLRAEYASPQSTIKIYYAKDENKNGQPDYREPSVKVVEALLDKYGQQKRLSEEGQYYGAEGGTFRLQLNFAAKSKHEGEGYIFDEASTRKGNPGYAEGGGGSSHAGIEAGYEKGGRAIVLYYREK